MAEEDAPELCVLNEDTNAISCIENPAAREEKQLWPSALTVWAAGPGTDTNIL